jgi:hypothetical protein
MNLEKLTNNVWHIMNVMNKVPSKIIDMDNMCVMFVRTRLSSDASECGVTCNDSLD